MYIEPQWEGGIHNNFQILLRRVMVTSSSDCIKNCNAKRKRAGINLSCYVATIEITSRQRKEAILIVIVRKKQNSNESAMFTFITQHGQRTFTLVTQEQERSWLQPTIYRAQ